MKQTLFRGSCVASGVLGLLALVGCGAKSVDLGDDGPPPPTLEGVWVGSVTSDVFVRNPKSLRLTIDAEGQGTLLVGEAALPLPTDPNSGSPPEAQLDAAEASGMLLHLYEGATYSTLNVQVSGASYGFEVDYVEAFEPFCAIQTPLLTEFGYRCLPNWGGGVRRENGEKRCHQVDPATGVEHPEDCLAVFLCSVDLTLGCFCTETECFAESQRGPQTVPFDLELDGGGNVLRGVLPLDSGSAPVVLVRESAK